MGLGTGPTQMHEPHPQGPVLSTATSLTPEHKINVASVTFPSYGKILPPLYGAHEDRQVYAERMSASPRMHKAPQCHQITSSLVPNVRVLFACLFLV